MGLGVALAGLLVDGWTVGVTECDGEAGGLIDGCEGLGLGEVTGQTGTVSVSVLFQSGLSGFSEVATFTTATTGAACFASTLKVCSKEPGNRCAVMTAVPSSVTLTVFLYFASAL